MTPFSPRLAVMIVCAGLTTACSHLTPSAQTQARVREKPDVFAALKPEQQADVLGGTIERGNTTDMVYLALGRPTRIVTSADGAKAMWVYVEYYSPSASFTTSFNNPNSTHYVPTLAGATSPKVLLGAVPSFNAPLHNEGLPSYLAPQEIHSTSNPSPVQSLTVPDMLSKTVYVFFVRGRVAEIKLDGDSSDQRTGAPNVAKTDEEK